MPAWAYIALLLLALLPGMAGTARAQPATVSGFVTDGSNGQGLELVNVVLRDEDGNLRGGTTNRDGLYIIPRLAPGQYALNVSYLGYRSYVDTLQLSPDETHTLNITLVPDEAELDEVVVESERVSGAARVTAGQQTIRPADLEHVPGPDVSGDLAGYLTSQPGVVATGDRGGQLFIRGGEPSQNLVQLDGILLYQPFHILGFYSAFPADILSRVDLYAGGFGSKFGGRISSVLDVTARSGNTQRFAGGVSLSPFISSATVEGPVIKDRVSFLASARQSTVEHGAARYIDEPMPFAFGDVFAKLHGVVTDNSRASVTALRTYDRGLLAEDTGGAPPEEIRWTNDAVGMRFLLLPRIMSIMADVHLSYSRLQSEFGPRGAPSRSSAIENTFLALEASYFGDRLDVEAGSMLRLNRLESALGGMYQNIELHKGRAAQWGSYLTFDYDLGGGLRVRPGVRVQFYKVRFEPYVEPRLRMVWERGAHQVSGAVGLYHQEIIGLSDRRDAASVFTAWTNIPRRGQRRNGDVREGRPQRALHAILGYRAAPTSWLDVSVEGYYKKLNNLFVAEWTAFPRFSTMLQPATGRSYGFDARLEARYGKIYGYVNYGFSSTRYAAEQAALRLWYGEERLRYRPPHDRRHQINMLVSTSLYGFGLNVHWEFGSGLPFSRARGFDGFAMVDDIEKMADVPGSRRVIYERPFNAVLPAYHRLDLSVDRSFRLRRAAITLQGSLINTYDRRNLFYLDVFTLQRVDQLPLVPSLGLKVAFE